MTEGHQARCHGCMSLATPPPHLHPAPRGRYPAAVWAVAVGRLCLCYSSHAVWFRAAAAG